MRNTCSVSKVSSTEQTHTEPELAIEVALHTHFTSRLCSIAYPSQYRAMCKRQHPHNTLDIGPKGIMLGGSQPRNQSSLKARPWTLISPFSLQFVLGYTLQRRCGRSSKEGLVFNSMKTKEAEQDEWFTHTLCSTSFVYMANTSRTPNTPRCRLPRATNILCDFFQCRASTALYSHWTKINDVALTLSLHLSVNTLDGCSISDCSENTVCPNAPQQGSRPLQTPALHLLGYPPFHIPLQSIALPVS